MFDDALMAALLWQTAETPPRCLSKGLAPNRRRFLPRPEAWEGRQSPILPSVVTTTRCSSRRYDGVFVRRLLQAEMTGQVNTELTTASTPRLAQNCTDISSHVLIGVNYHVPEFFHKRKIECPWSPCHLASVGLHAVPPFASLFTVCFVSPTWLFSVTNSLTPVALTPKSSCF